MENFGMKLNVTCHSSQAYSVWLDGYKFSQTLWKSCRKLLWHEAMEGTTSFVSCVWNGMSNKPIYSSCDGQVGKWIARDSGPPALTKPTLFNWHCIFKASPVTQGPLEFSLLPSTLRHPCKMMFTYFWLYGVYQNSKYATAVNVHITLQVKKKKANKLSL